MPSFMDFSNSLIYQLLEKGFQPVNFKQLDETITVMTLFLQKGSVIYITNIYNFVNNSASNFQNFVEHTEKYAAAIKEGNNLRHLIIYNIFISNTTNETISSYVLNGEEYLNQEIYEINYAVILEKSEMISSQNQPHNLIHIKKMIEKNLNPKHLLQQKELGDIAKTSQEMASIKQKSSNAFLTYAIVAINAILLISMELNGGSQNTKTLLDYGAMNYSLFTAGDYYRVLMASFLHIGVVHFLHNSLSLFIFGTRIEKYYGKFAFLVIYIVSGIFGNFLNAFIEPMSVLAGASSGIFGLIGAALALTQVTKKALNGLNFYTMAIFSLSGLLFGLMDPNIGNWAHLGGFVTGYILGLLFAVLNKRKNADESF